MGQHTVSKHPKRQRQITAKIEIVKPMIEITNTVNHCGIYRLI